ncbi:hypothetical protein PMAYCL1PPCAC_27944, partial [Pristionchus mayeri]
MASPSVETESSKISMVVERWQYYQVEQLSPIHHFNGYPWRLRLACMKGCNKICLSLICEKSIEAELWECSAMIKSSLRNYAIKHNFTSWDKNSQQFRMWNGNLDEGDK